MWSYKKFLAFLLLVVSTITISCGFKPLYSEYDVKKTLGGNLEIPDVLGKEGYHLKEQLVRRFGEPKKDAYLLELEIKTSKINEVISPNNEITSYLLIMTAHYKIKDRFGVTMLPTQKSVARTGFNSASNSTGYATQVAEEAAKKRLAIQIGEKIITRLSILSAKWLK